MFGCATPIERGAGRRIERALAAAAGKRERGGKRADQGERSKRADGKIGSRDALLAI